MEIRNYIKAEPVCDSISEKNVKIGSYIGELLEKTIDRWLLTVRETNPSIVNMFRDRELKPFQSMVDWAGEFAGKYLTNAVMIYTLTKDERLYDYLDSFVSEWISYQQEDGYLGPWPKGHQLNAETWDSWGHYHAMYGLLRWYRICEKDEVLAAVVRIADMYCRLFYAEGNPRLWTNNHYDKNLSPMHSFALLYQLTGEEKYLRVAKEIEKDLETPPAGDYIRYALAGTEYYECPQPRWESLHTIEGISEMYLATGEEKYKTAFMQIWKSILKTDVHNTGAFSTDEQAIGNPYSLGSIETCCVIAYIAAGIDMLRLTGEVYVADVIEWATLNSGLGALSPSGRWSTYNTPMEGYKIANYQDIVFQSRQGSPDLNCCSVNAPRIIGMITDWGVMKGSDGAIIVNYYGNSEWTVDGAVITEETGYPYDGKIRITVSGLDGIRKTLKFRIPSWSVENEAYLNGESLEAPRRNTYLTIDRVWSEGDILELTLDFTVRYTFGEDTHGEGNYEGKASYFYGPVLLCFDAHFDTGYTAETLPEFDAAKFRVNSVKRIDDAGYTFDCTVDGKNTVTLTDLYSAGYTGVYYTTWFCSKGGEPTNVTEDNIRRNANL